MIYHILHNPLAGSGKAPPHTDALPLQPGDTLHQHDITAITDLGAFLATLSTEDILVISGGDGTLNRFINDTDGMELPCELLYLPCGTGNDFLRDLERQASDGPLQIRELIRSLPFVEVLGKRYRFLNNVGFGIDGYCCEVGDAQRLARPDKPVNYTAIAIKGLLLHYKPTGATVIVDGKEYRYRKAWLAPTMKGRCYGGGMFAAPAQDRSDPEGRLSVMLFYGKGRLATLIAFPSIFKGEHIRRKSMVDIHTGKDIRVVFDSPRAVQIDGETITGVTEYHAYAAAPAPAVAPAKAGVHAET